MTDLYQMILFDLGGVVIELGSSPSWHEGGEMLDPSETWERWLSSSAVRGFESGLLGVERFAREVVDELGLRITPEEFALEFSLWPKGLYPGVRELLAEVRRSKPIGCLSNCNELHWPRFMEEMKLVDLFDVCFSSHELGAVKPDREVFERVVRILDCEPDDLLFLDDNVLNVEGARSLGLHARQVRGPDGIRAVLSELGVIV